MVVRQIRSHRRSAFTLMEMMAVVAIIVMLAGMGTWGYMRYLESARENKAKMDITHIGQAVEQYKNDTGNYPDNLQVLTMPMDNKPAFLEAKDLIDPWNQPYVYEPQNLNPATFRPRIHSNHPGPGGQPISNW
jgi:general secretion pathway protein G